MQRWSIHTLALASLTAFGGCDWAGPRQQPKLCLVVDAEGQITWHGPAGPVPFHRSATRAASHMEYCEKELGTSGKPLPVVLEDPAKMRFGDLAELLLQFAQIPFSHLTVNGVTICLPKRQSILSDPTEFHLPAIIIRIGVVQSEEGKSRAMVNFPTVRTWRHIRTSAEFSRILGSLRKQNPRLFENGVFVQMQVHGDSACDAWLDFQGAAAEAATPERVSLVMLDPEGDSLPKAGDPAEAMSVFVQEPKHRR